MRVPDDVLKCVVFVGLQSGNKKIYSGTAFIVSVLAERLHDTSHTYLVTANHVADKLEKKEFWVRANLRAGGHEDFRVPTTKWYRHPEGEKVDVALCPLPLPDTADVLHVGEDIFLDSPEKFTQLNIGVGDEVFIPGLFSKVQATVRNIPIVRTGTVAMLPDEPVPTKLGDIEAHLIEARSIGGLSGSPVFVRRTLHMGFTDKVTKKYELLGGAGSFYLLGLMHGQWDIDPKMINEPIITHVDGGVNVGIAIVVPARKILEVLHLPELDTLRKATEDHVLESQGTSAMDSASDEQESSSLTQEAFTEVLQQVSRKVDGESLHGNAPVKYLQSHLIRT